MKTALLVIDVQKLYTEIDNDYLVEDAQGIVERINEIVRFSIDKGYDIIYIRHTHKEDGSDSGRMFDFVGESEGVEFIEDSSEVEFSRNLLIAENSTIITKHRYDSFVGTGLDETLRSRGIEKVIIVGFMTNFCCESTARSAHDRDYFVDFVCDATGTPGLEGISNDDIIKTTCATLASGFANVVFTKDFIS